MSENFPGYLSLWVVHHAEKIIHFPLTRRFVVVFPDGGRKSYPSTIENYRNIRTCGKRPVEYDPKV